jgi:hypothetical protein
MANHAFGRVAMADYGLDATQIRIAKGLRARRNLGLQRSRWIQPDAGAGPETIIRAFSSGRPSVSQH